MSLLYKKLYINLTENKNKTKKIFLQNKLSPRLRRFSKDKSVDMKRLCLNQYFIDVSKRRRNMINAHKVKTSSCAPDHILFCRGSLTVEAALAGWIFFMLMVSLVSVIQLAFVYTTVGRDLKNTAEHAAMTTSVIEAGGAGQLYAIFMSQTTDQSAGYDLIRGGRTGISMLGSTVDQDKGEIEIQASYRVRPLLMYLPNIAIKLRHHLKIKIWNGYRYAVDENNDSDDQKIYYVTDYESVYHTSAQCSHLHLSISLVSRLEAQSALNDDGRHYTACSRCRPDSGNVQVLITSSGECYHASLSCSGLKRTIRQVSEIGDLRPCSRCGG